MSKRLTYPKSTKPKHSKLTNNKSIPFKVAFEDGLKNNYCFKHLDKNGSKSFQSFIDSTLGRSISEVESQFLRTKGTPKETIQINGIDYELIHFGKDRKKFRVFGYYNSDNYFVIKMLDPKHKYHSS